MTEIVLPRLGWTMEEGIFRGWLKRDGEEVKAGEPLFSVEGDKAVQDIEAIASGVVRIAANGPEDGDTIPVGTVLGRIDGVDSLPANTTEKLIEAPKILVAEPTERIREDVVRPQQAITPRARKAAKDNGIDASNIAGTGRDGRVRERDILAGKPVTSSTRQVIAQRMLHSQRTTAPVTLTTTADAANLVNLREQFKTLGGLVPSYTDLFIKLAAIALKKHPHLNARWQDDAIALQPDVHIGFAVDTDKGLLVPVVQRVAELSLRHVAARTALLISQAQAGKLAPTDMQGGTFTVTNLGTFGIDGFTPIINWPECAILGIGAIRSRPAVIDNRVVARQDVTLSLTFDHRLVDGVPAARFLKSLRESVENPSACLMT